MSTPVLITTESYLIAVIDVTCDRNEIQNVMFPKREELFKTVNDQGVKITGPWFTHHLRLEYIYIYIYIYFFYLLY